MKRYMVMMIFICSLMFVFDPGHAGLFAQDAGKDPVAVESIEQLAVLIENALKENDVQKLEEIKKSNLELVLGNLFLTTQKCNTLLDEGVKLDLSGEREKGDVNFEIVRVIAEIYQRAYDNSYLLDKVDLFSKWGNAEREKYLEAEKIFEQGEEVRKKYNLETSVILFNQSLSICREINYKEGMAKNLKSLGEAHRLLDKYEKAQQMLEDGLMIFREIKERLGEANCLLRLGIVHRMLSEKEKSLQRTEESLVIFREIKEVVSSILCKFLESR